MRAVDLSRPLPGSTDPARLARLTRHLAARLQDFGPGGPEVRFVDQEKGLIRAAFPGHSTEEVAEILAQGHRILVGTEGECALFQLSSRISFEELDYVWGCLYQIFS